MNYCPDQNTRFQMVDPRLDMNNIHMAISMLQESHNEDQSRWYGNSPVNLLAWDKIREYDAMQVRQYDYFSSVAMIFSLV